MHPDFVALQNYSTSAEAEMHVELLREAGIQAYVQGPQPGIFGAGFSGASVQGVTLMVAAKDVQAAFELIGEEQA
jgi:hypothetical protein